MLTSSARIPAAASAATADVNTISLMVRPRDCPPFSFAESFTVSVIIPPPRLNTALSKVADGAVATHARRLVVFVRPFDGFDNLLVALAACLLGHFVIARRDL